jgi:hypothetical protein
MLTTDLDQPSAARGWRLDRQGTRSNRLALEILGRFRLSVILSLIPLFREQQVSNSGKTTPGLYNEGLMAD